MNSDKCVLVVEDDPDISNILVEVFAEFGFNTITADNAAKALEQIKTQKIDLMTLDLRIPDKSGNEFLQELARISFAKPIVVISANLENLKPNALVTATLLKPFDMDNLLDIIEYYA